jgi:hypothetical protein
MKKYASLIMAFAFLISSIEVKAQAIPPAVAQTMSSPQKPRAYRSGISNGVNLSAIAAGVGIIVAIAAIAIISNNSHSH